ncbi:hypothetical protein [Sulfitobacter sp. DSM 110093]|uniref:hypothetical protein n=1 Tax=Sulfitobacter sp. DSM 110093 TaxID=2883127 RepID=UPI001FAC1CEC|nr:hypothetical protein [Sulfitobacter sp. DSM 110093]
MALTQILPPRSTQNYWFSRVKPMPSIRGRNAAFGLHAENQVLAEAAGFRNGEEPSFAMSESASLD